MAMSTMLRALCVALALCGSAEAAMRINPRGTGQVLLYPAYTVNSGQSTLLTLVNASDRIKVVQLTFREGHEGREVATLRLFLGARDAWSGTVFWLPEFGIDPPSLIANDRSCALPVTTGGTAQLPDGRSYWKFSRANISDLPPALSEYQPGQGSVEAIELGQLKQDVPFAGPGSPVLDPAPTCADMGNLDLSAVLDPPGGKLYGSFSLVDAATGSMLAGAATAIDGYSVVSLGGLPLADLAQGRTSTNPSDPVEALVDVDGRQVSVKYPRERAIDAVSALLMADTVNGEFVVDPSAGAKTDWVLTMPTRRYYTEYAVTGSIVPREPFARRAHGWPRGGCSYYEADVSDRDRHPIVPRSAYLVTPRPFGANEQGGVQPSFLGPIYPSRATRAICTASESVAFSRYVDQANMFRTSGVVRYGQTFELLDANVTATGGIARLRFGMPDPAGDTDSVGTPSVLPAGVEGPALRGLPVIGFATTLYVNAYAAPGVSFNYTSAVPLHFGAACATNGGVVIGCP